MPFDTLQYARSLEAAGVPREQAEAHAEALIEVLSAELVTKADLVRIEERLAAFRGELLTALERVHADNARLETRLTRAVWTAASLGGLVGSLVVVVAKILRWI